MWRFIPNPQLRESGPLAPTNFLSLLQSFLSASEQPKNPPLQIKGWATPKFITVSPQTRSLACSLPGEFLQWYALIVLGRHEEFEREAWATLYDVVGAVKGHLELMSRERLVFSSSRRISSLLFISTKARG